MPEPTGRPGKAGTATHPGDAAPPGTPGTGENTCPRCRGTGRIEGRECPDCEGTGTVNAGIGGG